MAASCPQCPHCLRYCLKDDRCNFVICGRTAQGFMTGAGCGRPWCYQCGGKLCGQNYCPDTGRLLDANEDHNRCGCERLPGHCPGGHNSHKRAFPPPHG